MQQLSDTFADSCAHERAFHAPHDGADNAHARTDNGSYALCSTDKRAYECSVCDAHRCAQHGDAHVVAHAGSHVGPLRGALGHAYARAHYFSHGSTFGVTYSGTDSLAVCDANAGANSGFVQRRSRPPHLRQRG
jgi:hypothetical protein